MQVARFVSLVIPALGLFTACAGEDPGRVPASAPTAGTRTRGALRAGAPSRDVTVSDGRIRVTIGQPNSTVAGIAPVSLVVDLETVVAWRGDTGLDVTVVDSELPAPNVITTVRANFIETIENNADGIEQSWRFEEAPGEAGDLAIAVGAAGLDYLGSDAGGLHLRRAGELDVSYSHGTWIDSSHTSAVPAHFDGGRILLTVPASVVAGSTFPAVLDPKIVVTPIIT